MKIDKEMFVNVSAGGTRIAVTENRKLVELHIERADYKRLVGNIYNHYLQILLHFQQIQLLILYL